MTTTPSTHPYFSLRIFTDAKAVELVAILASYLNSWVVDGQSGTEPYGRSGEYTTNIQPTSFQLVGGEAWDCYALIAAPARTLLEERGGFSFQVADLRRANASGGLSYSDLPVVIRSRFEVTPNYVELETWRYWTRIQREVAEEIEKRLIEQHHRTLILTVNGELVDYINTAYVDPSHRLTDLYEQLGVLIAEDDLNVTVRGLPTHLRECLPYMHRAAVSALRTAEHYYNEYRTPLDASPIVLEYFRALEIELRETLIPAIRSEWNTRGIIRPRELPRRLQRLYGAVLDGQRLEIGAAAYGLSQCFSEDRAHDPLARLVQEIMALAPGLSKVDVGPEEPVPFHRILAECAARLRNPAAHTGLSTIGDAQETREIVVGSDAKDGLLVALLST